MSSPAIQRADRRIVAIPGWSCGCGVWDRLASAAGWGEVTHVPVGSAGSPDAFLPLVMSSLGDEPAVIIGSSLGAMVAIEAAALLGNRVQALLLFGGTPRFTNEDPTRGWPARIVERMARRLEEDPRGVVERFQAAMFATGEEQEAHAFQRDPACHGGWTTAALRAGLDYLVTKDLTSTLRELACPVTWVHGGADTICPAGVLETIPMRHERLVIPSAGHLPAWTHSDEVAAYMRELVSDA